MSNKVRQQVIASNDSFLVQAPAGSGKTELLTQRILSLLTQVQEPEEILALTFTRKAAAEMRARVFESLHMPKPQEQDSHRMSTWLLAAKVLQHAHEKQWRLLENPNRLHIMTLDSLSSMLARQLPLLSGFGDIPTPSEQPQMMYQQAAEKTLNHALKHHQQAVEALLLHQDHNTVAVISLIANMLQNREQWLKYIAAHGRNTQALRDLLEHNLTYYLEHQLQCCDAAMPVAYKATLPALLSFSAQHGGLEIFNGLKSWPDTDVQQLEIWQAIADFLLTGSGSLRKTVNKNQGFPTDAKDEKHAIVDILSHLSDNPIFAQQWQELQSMPNSASFDDAQWHVLEALFTLLPIASYELQKIFMQQASSDFTEISLRALNALRDEHDRPSEVLLKLDYRIQHILVDEFQDTSELQIELLRCLTAGWQEQDGRSLFMVGDPMQSIYRFRKAEVSLFLETATNQVALPAVTPLSLQRNFRSSPNIVHWVNRAFAAIFPTTADAISGAVCHAQAEAACQHDGDVYLHLQHTENNQAEADAIINTVQEALQQQRRVGILARTRKHLQHIMQTLEKEHIAFRAVNILPLASQPETRTLRALTRALLHPADKASWLALLRAPCCGLNNSALFKLLAKHDDMRCVWDILHDNIILSSLSDNDHARVQHLIQALAPCMASAGRIAVRSCVESAWLRLGMSQLIDQNAHRNVETILQLLQSLEGEYIVGRVHFKHFDERLEKLYAAPNSSADASMVELMTIHGSKGLQWDVVILPAMGKSSGTNDAPMIAFTEAPIQDEGLFLLSPKAQTRSNDRLFSFIQSLEKNKDLHELHRQLYVACTRAESQLHIFGHVSEKSGNATKGSFLEVLLTHDKQCFGAHIINLDDTACDTSPASKGLQRMKDIPEPIAAEQALIEMPKINAFAWSGLEAAPIGNVLHAIFQHIAEIGIEQWQAQKENSTLTQLLIAEGLSGDLLETARQRCHIGLHTILNSSRGRWILSQEHRHSHAEWAISHRHGTHVSHYIIDRSFEDEHGTHWIIDYKTARHEGGSIEHFLDEEYQRHHHQLQRYALALRDMGYHNLRLALYFPMLDAWREWEALPTTISEEDHT